MATKRSKPKTSRPAPKAKRSAASSRAARSRWVMWDHLPNGPIRW